MGKYIIWVYLCMPVLLHANALYFYLNEDGDKCFFQELAAETLLLGNYRCSAADAKYVENEPNSKYGMIVEIKDPHKRTVLSRLYQHLGRFSYKSHEPGIYTICLFARTNYSTRNKIKIDFELKVGEHAINHSLNIKRNNLTSAEERYHELVGKAIEISKEMDYLRFREEKFRETAETISHRVLLWMIGETVLLVIMGLWQIEKLKKFFESKKLV